MMIMMIVSKKTSKNLAEEFDATLARLTTGKHSDHKVKLEAIRLQIRFWQKVICQKVSDQMGDFSGAGQDFFYEEMTKRIRAIVTQIQSIYMRKLNQMFSPLLTNNDHPMYFKKVYTYCRCQWSKNKLNLAKKYQFYDFSQVSIHIWAEEKKESENEIL